MSSEKTTKRFLGEDILNNEQKEKERQERKGKPVSFFELSENASVDYKITSYQTMMANDRQLVSVEATTVWKYAVLKKTDSFYDIKLQVQDHAVKNDTAGMDNFIEFSKLFNRPLNEIILRLNNFGEIIAVLSQGQIYESWQRLKNEELHQYKDDEGMKGFFEAGENDYSNTLPLLKFNVQYFLFFDTVYQKLTTHYQSKNIPFPSKLFQGKNPLYDKLQEFSFIENSIVVKNDIQLASQQDYSLKDFYNTNYKNMLMCDFNLTGQIISEATYSRASGLLIACKVNMLERASKHLVFNTNLKIEQVR